MPLNKYGTPIIQVIHWFYCDEISSHLTNRHERNWMTIKEHDSLLPLSNKHLTKIMHVYLSLYGLVSAHVLINSLAGATIFESCRGVSVILNGFRIVLANLVFFRSCSMITN